jgi:hypothetical protein
MLAGGRYMEAMRTHGVAKCTAYKNLNRLVRAVNDCKTLELDSSYDMLMLE